MPPKAAAGSSKSDSKAKQKKAEELTFGLKNKNKSAKMAKYVQQVQTQVLSAGNNKAQLAQETEKAAKAARRADEERRKAELAELFKPVQTQQKVPFGVDPKTMLCQFFKAGQCQKGDRCKFSHDVNVERKEAKIDMYTDKRSEDTMDKWDQDKLTSVVNQKHSSGNANKPTEIVCKYFVDAIESQKYGWFWDCPNGGDKCKYRHALPPGYVLKKKETPEERAEREEMEKENQITLEEFLETERHQLGTRLTPITEESFAKWKADKKIRQATEKAETDKQKAEAYKQFKAGVKSGMAFSGRELFDFNPELAAGDADEDIADTNMREEEDQDGGPANEERRAGDGYLGEDDVEADEDAVNSNESRTDRGKQKASSSGLNSSVNGDDGINGDQSVSVNEDLFGDEELAGLSDQE
ncbi:hypothetical protein SeLEV6574_g05680 [Synchytrium endobioticum]|uniref:C3H1-type domain-containing protein n=1 Tax=Synchytrium endobioticum TaxID=286115 RepID=A0A507CT35_9FUNG|nr:hypothetical protein SeLEV6574_g05680 [Synchytrium endobioticum]